MEFKNGDLVKKLVFNDDSTVSAGGEYCDTIIVSMESGQMAGVPWFECWKDRKLIAKWNGAFVHGVLF